jgi:hypothetical protein
MYKISYFPGRPFGLVVISLFTLALIFGFGCENKPTFTKNDLPLPEGSYLGHGECEAIWKKEGADPPEACIEYRYDSIGLLTFTHMDAYFNCCLDSITSDVTYENGVVYVDECSYLMNGMGCDCYCPYDLDYIVENIGPGTYMISISMNGMWSYASPLEFEIYLPPQPVSDTLCIEAIFEW